MNFNVDGKRFTRIVIEIEEEISGDLEISKKEVMKFTGCKAVEDGDPSAWYGYVEDALREGAPHKVSKCSEIKVLERNEHTHTEWDELTVDY